MNMVKSKRLHVLGFSLMMAVLFTIFSFTLVHGANREMKELILNGDCQQGSVNNSSQYYFFKVPSNGRIRIGVSNDELVLRVFRDEACTDSIAISSNGYANVAAGIYYAEVSGTGTYEISANFSKSSQHDLEPNDTMRDAIPLESDEVMRGNADQVYGDVDWYVLDLKEKSLVRIVLNNNGEFAMVYDESGDAYSFVYKTTIVTWNPGKYYIEVVSSEPSYGYYDIAAYVWEYPTPNKITKGVYKGDRKVELTWSKSQHAEGYYLFYKTSKDGSWINLANITSAKQTTYTHTYGPSNGETYYYGVQAYRSCSVFGEIYNQDDAEGYPVTAAKTSVTPSLNNPYAKSISNEAIQVSWDVKEGTPHGYYIYRNENGGGYTRVATIFNGFVEKWKDTSIKKGIYYQYKVKPYVENSNEKVFGKAVVTGTVKAVGSLSKVKGVSIRKNGKYITVSWKKNKLAVGYKVYRKKGSGSFKLVKTVTSNCYNDKNVFKGKSYTYKIKAYYDNYEYDSRRKKYYRDSTVTSEFSQQVSMKRQ